MTTFTATPQQVERVIAAVLPHTSSDAYISVICTVRIELRDLQFIAAGTDRYTLGVAWADISEWADDAESLPQTQASVYADDLRRLFTFLRPHKKTKATWTITDSGLTVEVAGESLALRQVNVTFPKWRELLGRYTERGESGPAVMKFTPAKIDSFNKTAKALGEDLSGSMRLRFGPLPSDPPLVQIGDHFIGLLMPQRMEDEPPALDLLSIGIEAPKAVAA